MHQEHDFSIELFDAGWRSLGWSPASPDWAPLAEHVHFSGIRRGLLPPVMSQPPARLQPIWRERSGEPFVGSVRIEMSSPTGERHSETFPVSCFKAEAKRLAGEHIARGSLQEGEVFRYRVAASPRKQLPKLSGRMALLDIEEIEQPLVLTESSLQGLLDRSISLGGRGGTDDDVLPAFVAQELVRQCVDLVRAAGPLETGGILVGRLCRDPSAGLFLEVTAQIPAKHTDQQEMQVTFTDRTWSAARDALARRKSDESIVGWFHSHPDFCAEYTQQERETSLLNGIFFSNTDISLHRTMFPRAWHVGLLFSNRPAGIIPALYGWRRGNVAARPFHLLAPPREHPDPLLLKALGSSGSPILATVGGDEHGTR